MAASKWPMKRDGILRDTALVSTHYSMAKYPMISSSLGVGGGGVLGYSVWAQIQSP